MNTYYEDNDPLELKIKIYYEDPLWIELTWTLMIGSAATFFIALAIFY